MANTCLDVWKYVKQSATGEHTPLLQHGNPVNFYCDMTWSGNQFGMSSYLKSPQNRFLYV